MSETARKRCVFHGRVQGVGFRAFCRETASALGVQGWVRNRPDGAVEMEAESSPQVLAELIARLSGSHPPARVDRVDAMDLPSSGKEAGIFEVLY